MISSIMRLVNRIPLPLFVLSCFGMGMAKSVLPAYAQSASVPAGPRTPLRFRYTPLANVLAGSRSQSPVLPARVGKQECHLILDTGAAISLLKQSVAQNAQLKEVDAPTIREDRALANALSIQGQVRGIEALLEVGDSTLPPILFYMTPDAVLERVAQGNASLAGIIGANFLKNNAVYFDFDKQEVTLWEKGNLTPEERAKIGFDTDTTTIAPLISARSVRDQFLVNLFCNDKPIRLFLDTGAEHTFIHRPLSDFGIAATAASEVRTRSVYGQSKALSAPAKLSLGTTTISGLPVYFEHGSSSEGDGLLGMDTLSQHYVLIDFPAKKIYLRPRKIR